MTHTHDIRKSGSMEDFRFINVPNTRSIGPYNINTVQLGDCIEGMRRLPSNSIDVVIADPPYNASKGNVWTWDNSVKGTGFGGAWSTIMAEWDDMPLSEYVQFTTAWLAEVKRVVRPTGSLWVHGTFHNIGIVNFVMQFLQIEIINEIVWYKRNSFPNLSGRRLTASHESILWGHTGGKHREYYFDYDVAKALGNNVDALKQPGKQMRTVWDIPNNKPRREIAFGKHPAQKPLRLIKQMMKISTKPSDIVLVPFVGSGSECVAAKELDRQFLGFESSAESYELSLRRINDAEEHRFQSNLTTTEKRGEDGSQLLLGSSLPVSQSIPSLIKWSGSKRSQAQWIARQVPDHQRYFEPFLGGGSMLYLFGRSDATAGDIYNPLMELWRIVQSDHQHLIGNYASQWESLQNDCPDYYYEVRGRFNRKPNPFDLNFLMRTCVNGIVRFNDNGAFNNSFHLSRKGMNPNRYANIVNQWHHAVRDVRFVCQDYAVTLADTKAGDFVYLDPPYAGNNARYISSLDIDRLFSELESLNRRNVKWALSFDGWRGNDEMTYPVPKELYRQNMLIRSGHSAVEKVLNGPVKDVHEMLYLNYA